MTDAAFDFDRYRRQIRFAPFGEEGQRRLSAAGVLVVGCGALGSVVADLLVRAGTGRVRIVDRDFLEADNLHRQVLFGEEDVRRQLPKAVAAAERLRTVNSAVTIEPVVADLAPGNIASLARDVDCIVDGTDNFATRYLVNDFAVSSGTPWVFGGIVGAEGQVLAIVPGETPCLSCLMPEPPPAELQPTCETAGVLGPAVGVVASLQAMEAVKLLSGNRAAVNPRMTLLDLWTNNLRNVGVDAARSPDCRVCGQRDFAYLEGRRGDGSVALCGRNAVQLAPPTATTINLADLAARLQSAGPVTANQYLLRLEAEGYRITVFADGRAIIGGTDDPAIARAVHARYLGG
ncbi:MAG: thiamine biosynthesis protein ThiF [Planctomycetaceae bacterium]|nr:thiamine biosynthesis protein ThiF [Planctomycetaceae bacterium]